MRFQDELSDLKTVSWKLFAPLVLICAIIFPANLSTSAMIFLAGLMLLYLGGVPFKYLALLFASILTLGALVISLSLTVPTLQKTFPRAQTWVNRIVNFSENKTIKSDENYQVRMPRLLL